MDEKKLLRSNLHYKTASNKLSQNNIIKINELIQNKIVKKYIGPLSLSDLEEIINSYSNEWYMQLK